MNGPTLSPLDLDENYIAAPPSGASSPRPKPQLAKRKSVVSLSNHSLVIPELISTRLTTSVSLEDGVSSMAMDDDGAALADELAEELGSIFTARSASLVPTLNIHSDSDLEDDHVTLDMGSTLDQLIRDDKSMLQNSVHSVDHDPLDDLQVSLHQEVADCDDSLDLFLQFKKHFFILSSAGKPIYSMHGSDEIISGYMGIIQTIMSYFKESEADNLRSLVTSNGAKFVFYNQNPIILLAISSQDQSDLQLLHQLQFLYNFLLLTLSKPHIDRVFARRENFDLRKLLGRSDIACLDSICNDLCNNTNPGLIIGGLEAIKLRLPIRRALDEILLRNRTANLLYGLIVAPKGRLLTVLRPRRHTLHISDLQLLFEMIFNTNTFKSNTEVDDSYSEEEFWVPVCLPKFNLNGFLYAFVKFVELSNGPTSCKISVILISADKAAFFEMRDLANKIVGDLQRQNNLYNDLLRSLSWRSSVSINVDFPTPLVKHFAYKSKSHIQYVFPEIHHNRDKIMFIYKKLQNSVLNHYSNANSRSNFISYTKFELSLPEDSTTTAPKYVLGVVLITKTYELYLITNDGLINKRILMKSIKTIVKWCMKNQERLFVCGGAVF